MTEISSFPEEKSKRSLEPRSHLFKKDERKPTKNMLSYLPGIDNDKSWNVSIVDEICQKSKAFRASSIHYLKEGI